MLWNRFFVGDLHKGSARGCRTTGSGRCGGRHGAVLVEKRYTIRDPRHHDVLKKD